MDIYEDKKQEEKKARFFTSFPVSQPYPQLLGYSLPVQITMFSSYLLQPLCFLLCPFLFVDAWMLVVLPKLPQFF